MHTKDHRRALELLREMDRLRRAWKQAIPNTGINKSEFFTLYTLRHPQGHDHSCSSSELVPMTLSSLAKTMKQSLPAVSQRITKLEELGYVRRVPDERDRRTLWIHLTQSGTALLQSTGEEMLGKLERVLQRLDTQDGVDAQLLTQAFRSLATAVEAEFSTHTPL